MYKIFGLIRYQQSAVDKVVMLECYLKVQMTQLLINKITEGRVFFKFMLPTTWCGFPNITIYSQIISSNVYF